MDEDKLIEKFVPLNAFLKNKGFANSGGDAKIIIRSGKIKLNGEIETRNKKKLFVGDKIYYDNQEFIVEDSDICEK